MLSNFAILLCTFEEEQLHDACHMVPVDQLKASLQMLQSWMKGKLAITQINLKGFLRSDVIYSTSRWSKFSLLERIYIRW